MIMISQPEAVTDVILEAVATVGRRSAPPGADMSVDATGAVDARADRFGPVQQIDAGVLERRLRRRRAGRRPGGPPAARLAVRHPQLRRRRAAAGGGRLPGDRPVPARLRHDALPVRRRRSATGEQAALAVDAIALMDALGIDDGDRRRLRLGRAHRRHHRGALAGALHGPGLGERLPDRQPGGRAGAAAAGGRAAVVVPVLLRHRARPGRLRAHTGATSPG